MAPGFRYWPRGSCCFSCRCPTADANKAAIEAGKKATAFVEIREGNTLTASASAFCIDRTGIFVTNNHVAPTGAKDNKLTLVIDSGLNTQRSVKAAIFNADAEFDLAILRADHAGPYESLELSDPASIRGLAETAQVTVFGYPLGNHLAMQNDARPEASVSLSRITALRHDRGELQLIQLDGSINPGNSGGPVVDERGKVIGIISSGIPGTAISFAIPANRIGRLLVAANVTLRARAPADAAAVFDEVLAETPAADAAGRASVPDEAARKAARKLIDGKHAFTGTRKAAESIRLTLSGGDSWSKGTTEFWDFRLETPRGGH